MSIDEQSARPRLRPYLRSLVLTPEKMLVKGGTTTVILRGASVEDLASVLLPSLDGTRTVEEITAAFGDVDPTVVIEAIDLFKENGLLEDAATVPPSGLNGAANRYRHQTTYWLSIAGDRYGFQEKLAAASATIFGLGAVGRTVTASLAQAGFGRLILADSRPVQLSDALFGYTAEHMGKPRSTAVRAQTALLNGSVTLETPDLGDASPAETAQLLQGSQLGIFCSDASSAGAADADSLDLCMALNDLSLDLGIPWTRAVTDHHRGVVGPSVLPRETACLTCFRLRLRSNLAFSTDALAYERHLSDPASAVAPAVLIPFAALVGQYAALEAVKLVTQFARPSTAGAFVALNSLTGEFNRHDVLRLPRCPSCGPTRDRPQMKIWDIPEGGS